MNFDHLSDADIESLIDNAKTAETRRVFQEEFDKRYAAALKFGFAAAPKSTKHYRVVGIRNKDKKKFILFPGPLTHDEACNCKKSLTQYPWRTDMIEEIE